MYSSEQNIRNYLKSLTAEDIANSVYLFGVNFDTEPIESIMSKLSALYEETKVLKGMIDRDFKSQNDELVLLPKDRATQEIVIHDYYCKESALAKALSNSYVYNAFINYKRNEGKKEQGPKR